MTDIPLLNAAIFAGLGLLIFVVAFRMVGRLLPFQPQKEIVEERNVAAAIVLAAVILGMAWIIAATMH
jgi:uncharacterized membrane protein YjfL (UPF0719 family)